ncbi:hypothetical protein FDECE_2722 [Fusarium decemcellulare]|nr:hypothetical protein FDECE_2722 [Fusarium decemcellulare]
MPDELAKGWAIGIDLGTANTRVAVFRNDRLEIIPDADGSHLMPSCVSFTDRGRLIGSPAKRQSAFNPNNTVFSVKRLLGQRFQDPEVQLMLKHHPYSVTEENGYPAINADYMGEKRTFSTVEILSMILSRAKENAEAYLGSPVIAAILGIPAHFFTHHRSLILDAATIAGLKVIHTMTSPYAAVTAHAHQTMREKVERNILVFDLGANSCHAALATTEEGIIDMRAVFGDPCLGGEDFVNRLVVEQVGHIKRSWKTDIVSNGRALRRLRTACETAIHDLSSAAMASITISSLFEGKDWDSTITRLRFEEICQDLFRCTIQPIERVLADAKMEKSQVDQILLVGGCSRILRVQKLIYSFFDGKDLSKALNPDEADVYGLALTAAILSGETSSPSLNEILTLEVLPRSIGYEVEGGMMKKLVSRNTTVPTKKSEILTRTFNSNLISKYEPYISPTTRFLKIFEGERQWTKDNVLLGQVDIETIRPSALEFRLECTVEADRYNYKASCTLTCKDNGRSIKLDLDSVGHLSKREMNRMIADATRYKKVDDAEAERVKLRVDLDSHIATLIESVSEGATSQEKEELLDSVKNIREWADLNEFAEASEYRRQSQRLQDIEKLMESRRQMLRELLAQGLEEARQKVNSSTLTPSRAVMLSEITTIDDWFNSSPQTDPFGYQRQLNQLNKIMARLEMAVEAPKNHDSEDHGRETPKTTAKNGGNKDKTKEPRKHQNATSTSTQARAQPASEDQTLESLFSQTDGITPEPFSDAQFERISTFLRNKGDTSWSTVPRLYTVLRLINQLDAMEIFMAQGITDIWFPFAANTLPSALNPTIKFSFLQAQSVVLSKGFKLEKGGDRGHIPFSRDEALPFQVIGRLGRGAHGSVDKVMSIISHREYARKTFRKTGGLSREKVNTFITELKVLKRVNHRHCVELIGSYSDAKHFALIMEPVGDYNLAEYYHKAKGNADMLSLMRSFLGCLTSALQYLHGSRIRHRDIKPQNIVVKRDCPLITDFGIAYSWENLKRGTTTADSSKTMIYAAPEVVRVEARNESADVWSLGCVFLEIATVLKGEEVQNMRERFRERSDRYDFHANREEIGLWMEQLRGVPTTTDDVVLDWAASMLQPVSSERPMAAQLFDEIADESTHRGVLFCGPCCLDDDGSTSNDEDDSHLWCDSNTESR